MIGEGTYPQGDPSDVDSPEHQALALEVAQKSIILLKNEGNLLPLDLDSLGSIALIGPNANVAQMDGKGSSVVKSFYMITPREGIQDRAPDVAISYVRGCDINSNKVDGFAAAVDAAQDPDVDVVIFVGGLDATQEGENVDALIYAFYPGQEGGNAIADVLFGNVNPGGKLPVSMPVDDSQLPKWSELDFSNDLLDGFGYRRYDALGTIPQYAFGYGLSFTTFEYGNLSIIPTSADGDAIISVGVDVTNTGARTGDEVAQLYLGCEDHPLPMPVKQLRGFRRITLAPGETRRVTFELRPEELSFWSVAEGSFRVKAGTYTVRVGGASDNLPLDGTFRLDDSVLYDSLTG